MNPRWIAIVLVVCALGCSVDSRLEARLEREARNGLTGLGTTLRVELCGYEPPRWREMQVVDLELSRRGDDERGSGEMSATLIAPSGARCAGRLRFTYRRYRSGDGTTGYGFDNVARIGARPAWTSAITSRATQVPFPSAIDATLTDDWPALDGVRAASFVFDVPAAGRYSFRFPNMTAHERDWFVLYRDGQPVRDRFGGITDRTLEPGRMHVLVLSEHDSSVRFELGQPRPPPGIR